MWRQRWDGNETCILEGPTTDDLKLTIVAPTVWPEDAEWIVQAYVRVWNPPENYEQAHLFDSTDLSDTGIIHLDLMMTVAYWVDLAVNTASRGEWVVQLMRVGGDGQTITIMHGPLVFTQPTPPFAA